MPSGFFFRRLFCRIRLARHCASANQPLSLQQIGHCASANKMRRNLLFFFRKAEGLPAERDALYKKSHLKLNVVEKL